MKDFNKEKPVIGIVWNTLEQAEWFARNLGGKLSHSDGIRIFYESDKFIFECRRYGYKGGTPHWDGIIFACEKEECQDQIEDWLNTVR